MTADEVAYYTAEGNRRTNFAKANGLVNLHGTGGGNQSNDVPGAGAEYAYSLFTGLEWTGRGSDNDPGRGRHKGPDVGGVRGETAWQVRWTRTQFLWLQEIDDPSQRFALVRGGPVAWDMIGWLWGYEAMQDKWFHEQRSKGWRTDAYRVPIEALRPLPAVGE